MSAAKQITERNQPNLEAVAKSNADTQQANRKWFCDIAKLFSGVDSDLGLEPWHAITRRRVIASRPEALGAVLWLNANLSWTRARHVDAYIDLSKTENLARYGRARWPF